MVILFKSTYFWHLMTFSWNEFTPLNFVLWHLRITEPKANCQNSTACGASRGSGRGATLFNLILMCPSCLQGYDDFDNDTVVIIPWWTLIPGHVNCFCDIQLIMVRIILRALLIGKRRGSELWWTQLLVFYHNAPFKLHIRHPRGDT